MLKAGVNEIRLAPDKSEPFPPGKDALFTAVPASIMYDAVRFEVDSPDAKALMKRVPPPALTAPYNPGPHPTPGLKVAMVPAQ
jgi:hypothetical protein